MKSIEEFAASHGEGKRAVSGRIPGRGLRMALALSMAAMAIGCGSNKVTTVVTTTADPSQLYFAPGMDNSNLATYAIDDTANTFVRSTYGPSGATITDAGTISTSALPDGIVSLAATYINSGGNGTVTSSIYPVAGSWAVVLPGQAALIDLNIPAEPTSQQTYTTAIDYFAPAVPANSCPSLPTAQTFQFVTIPNRLNSSSALQKNAWNPKLETAYGSVQVVTSGSSVAFSSVTQNLLPEYAVNAATPPSFSTAAKAVCAPTYYGQVISVPGVTTVNSNGIFTPTATIGIGPSGFMVEDAGSGAADATTGLAYENLLGAGYGAIGLPQPSSDLTSALIGAQYRGFLYFPATSSSSAFSLIASFGGISNPQTSCAPLLSQLSAASPRPSSNIVYGGEFAGNNPASNATGNCDLAIDLGAKQAANGLYDATIYVGAAFPQNSSGVLYSFSAVAVAGQLDGKNAIFVIGADTTGSPSRAWGIYLLQSN